ncbi:MAG: carotenoid oxygenase family protein [Myxococcota bacterium]|nr:carotenoid oxygenase family protein [Deltaproteobacteria bacterium]MDQ3341238.1 carotenoid oxygenase family protein [Myxococcota bacterium]
MKINVVHRYEKLLPADDDHPYRTGAWQPNLVEYDAEDLDVIEGAIPTDLAGTYLRNTENPLLPAIGRYHPFDGDGMLHAIRFAGGRASYRNRMVRTTGLAQELAAGAPQWAGIIEAPAKSLRPGTGARGGMKDASSTDVVVHAGRALTSFYQCGELYAHDPHTLEPAGTLPWVERLGFGASAHPKLDEQTGELIVFGYGTTAPYLRLGIVSAAGELVRTQDVPLPGPRLPHDIAFTEHYAIVGDFPLFWDPELLATGVYRPRWHPHLPTRLGVVPRAGGEVRWFEAAPTYVLHFINAFEDGDSIVVDGYFQTDPMPRPDPADGPWAGLKKLVDLGAVGARPHRWRLDLATGLLREERLFDVVSEFPSIDGRIGGRRHSVAYAMTAKPGWFLFDGIVRFDLESGDVQRFRWPDGVYGSEAPLGNGYLMSFVTTGECHIFDERHIDAGPIARVRLPERICAGTHACWSADL